MDMKKSADMVINTCMGAKEGETVLIVTDTCTDEKITKALYTSAVDAGCEALLLTMEPRAQHGAEPPALVEEAMKNADVLLAPASKSLTHTKARKHASENGTRTATMPGITIGMMEEGGLNADYEKINSLADELLETLKGSKEVRITTELGTDLVIDVDGGEWMADTGMCQEKGQTTNLPAGEMYIAPKNVNGKAVIDGSMAGIGLLEEPLVIDIRDRKAVSFEGEGAEKLEEMVNRVEPDGRNIAELGIGINSAAMLIGVILEDEKVGGTIHIALGDNSTFGGDVSVDLHLDGIITGPKVLVDGKDLKVERFA
ncbi:aminopeptidase [Methanococcoides sp. LMO-2]|uniref:Aminopeptidase n=1 Tax=Methanococcoides cohabitans TaxID=3136559 RepID=A0ABU9KVD5_9EURY